MRKAFKYRCYPSRTQQVALETMLETHRHLYNRALAERKTAWEGEQRTVRYPEQSGWLKEDRRTNPYLSNTNFSSCQATLRRLDRAFAAFFRRLGAGEKPGYPRFRGTGRFDSVEFPKYGDGCRIKDARAEFQPIGALKLKLHRVVCGNLELYSHVHPSTMCRATTVTACLVRSAEKLKRSDLSYDLPRAGVPALPAA